MIARCKFIVARVTHEAYGGRMVRLETAYDSKLSEEDRVFCKATPSGHMEVVIQNAAVFDTFTPGKYVYVDVIPME